MNKYEIGFIVSPEANEEEYKRIVESVVSTINKGGGKVEQLDEWGLKKLAFPITKFNDGFYVFVTVEMNGKSVGVVEKRLRQIEKIIRFISFRLDDKLEKANKLTKKWKKQDQLLNKAREARMESETTDENGDEEDEHAAQ